MKLIFGVVDIPYSAALPAAAKRSIRWRAGKKPWQHLGGFTTTGDVADILERRYGIMGYFYEKHGQEIADDLTDTLEGKLENILLGAPYSGRLFEDTDFEEVQSMFRKFLDDREMDGQPGVPTGAAQKGVNHRLQHPYAKANGERPSFIDSGTYQLSMRARIDD